MRVIKLYFQILLRLDCDLCWRTYTLGDFRLILFTAKSIWVPLLCKFSIFDEILFRNQFDNHLYLLKNIWLIFHWNEKNHQVAPLLKNWRKCNKIIDYSTIFAHPEITGVAKEPENLENLKCVSLMRCFSPEFDKNSKNHRFLPTFCLFLHIFWFFSNLAEKQRMKLSNLKCLRFSSSFDTHATSGGAIIVGEKNFCQNSHSVLLVTSYDQFTRKMGVATLNFKLGPCPSRFKLFGALPIKVSKGTL